MHNVFEQAVSLLARREHGRYELQQKLLKKGCDTLEVEQAIERCEQLGYQSDARFIEQFCQYRFNQGDGPLKIKHALQQKGIDAARSEPCLAQFDWLTQARKVFDKKFSILSSESFDAKLRQKQVRFMQSRGFNAEQIRACINNQV